MGSNTTLKECAGCARIVWWTRPKQTSLPTSSTTIGQQGQPHARPCRCGYRIEQKGNARPLLSPAIKATTSILQAECFSRLLPMCWEAGGWTTLRLRHGEGAHTTSGRAACGWLPHSSCCICCRRWRHRCSSIFFGCLSACAPFTFSSSRHHMPDAVRIQFIVSGQAANLCIALVVRRILVALARGEDSSVLDRLSDEKNRRDCELVSSGAPASRRAC